jgi:hypothetical protein
MVEELAAARLLNDPTPQLLCPRVGRVVVATGGRRGGGSTSSRWRVGGAGGEEVNDANAKLLKGPCDA